MDQGTAEVEADADVEGEGDGGAGGDSDSDGVAEGLADGTDGAPQLARTTSTSTRPIERMRDPGTSSLVGRGGGRPSLRLQGAPGSQSQVWGAEVPKPRSSVALTYNGARSSEADFHGPLRDFVELPPQLVDEHLRWRVGLAVRAARRELKPGPVEVTWVTPAEWVRGAKRVHAMPHRWGGWANGHEPDRIYVRADDELEAMETALHECRHLRQYQRRDEFPDYDGREADAIDWASRAMRLPAYPVG